MDYVIRVVFLGAPVRAEVDEFNYASRVTVPTLMLNGRYDVSAFPYETTVKPMFEMLGTPNDRKRIILTTPTTGCHATR